MTFELYDIVKFVPENFGADINSESSKTYKDCIGKLGVVTEVTPHLTYPYRVFFKGAGKFLFLEEEIKLFKEGEKE